MRRVTPRRAPLVLGALFVLVLAVVIVGIVFERSHPSTGQPVANQTTAGAPAEGPAVAKPTTPPATTPAPVKPPHYVFPVVGNYSYERTHHDYPATDIIAPCGSTVRATTDGVILEVNRVDKWIAKTDLGPDRGGLSVSLLGDDGVRYYGSHFRAIGADINAGVRVKAGQTLGQVGETGDAGVCHLHYGISPICARTGDWWIRRGEIWPWSFLDSWRKGGQLSPVSAIAAYSRAHGCPSVKGIPEP